MKRTIYIHLFFLFFLALIVDVQGGVLQDAGNAGSVDRETFVYSEKDGVSLKLDKYRLKQSEGKQTCVLFMFGGGFRNGERTGNGNLQYYDFLAKQGYTVIAIDYRLGLKNVYDSSLEKIIPALGNAIYMAVEDLYDATNYTLQYASEWDVDSEKIVISGSSAGAIAVLQAAYEQNQGSAIAKKLPAGFEYAGVIGFAGAIFSKGEMNWKEKVPPMLLFHGDRDATVPFAKLEMGGLQFCGSYHIAEQLKRKYSSHCFFRVVGAEHEISTDPMKYNLPDIQRFISLFVENKQQLMIHSVVEKAEKLEGLPPVKFEDFIKNNFK